LAPLLARGRAVEAGFDAVPRDLAGRARSHGPTRRNPTSRTLGRVAVRAVHQREHQARLGLGARVNTAGIALRVAESDADYEAWITDEVGAENLGTLFLRGRKLGYLGAVTGLALQVGIGTQSLRAGVIVGGASTILCGLVCAFVMAETGFRRKPRSERASAVSQLRTQA